MKNKMRESNEIKPKIYVKPDIKLEVNMSFMFDAVRKSKYKVACRQCSSCHGCR